MKRVVITGISCFSSICDTYDELIGKIDSLDSGMTEVFSGKLSSNLFGKISEDKYNENYIENSENIMEKSIKDLVQKYPHIWNRFVRARENESVIVIGTSNLGHRRMENNVNLGAPILEYMDAVKTFREILSNVKAPLYISSSACTASSTAVGIACDQIIHNNKKIALVGGVDGLEYFSCIGFHSLKSLDNLVCQPFSNERNGINIGEAAVFFIFEELESAILNNSQIYCEVVGYGTGNDAYHMTKPDETGEGALKTMIKASDGIENIDYINCHGTATQINDSVELKAIEKFSKVSNNTYLTSTKSLTGHCLGAAGAIELALSIATLQSKVIPSYGYRNPNSLLDSKTKIISKSTKLSKINTVLSNSYAFGGSSATIVLRNYDEKL